MSAPEITSRMVAERIDELLALLEEGDLLILKLKRVQDSCYFAPPESWREFAYRVAQVLHEESQHAEADIKKERLDLLEVQKSLENAEKRVIFVRTKLRDIWVKPLTPKEQLRGMSTP